MIGALGIIRRKHNSGSYYDSPIFPKWIKVVFYIIIFLIAFKLALFYYHRSKYICVKKHYDSSYSHRFHHWNTWCVCDSEVLKSK